MRKMFISIIMLSLPLFIIWLFLLAIRNNYDLSNVRINLYATIKQFENITSDNFYFVLTNIKNDYANLTFDELYHFVQINDITSFFRNVGIFFNSGWQLVLNFFNAIWVTIKGVLDFLVFIITFILNFFIFVFNPVQF